MTKSFSSVKESHTSTQTSLNSKEELLQTLLTGLSSSSSTGGGYMGQLADAKARLAQASAEEEQSRVKLGMSQKDLKTLEKRWKEVEKEAGEGRQKLQEKRAEVERLRKKVEASGWSSEKELQNESALRTAKAEVRQLTEVRSKCPVSLQYLMSLRIGMLSANDSRQSTSAIRHLRRALTDQESKDSWLLSSLSSHRTTISLRL